MVCCDQSVVCVYVCMHDWASEASPTLMSTIETKKIPARADIYIGECSSTLYVGLSGIVRNPIQSLRGWTRPFNFFFLLRDVQG